MSIYIIKNESDEEVSAYTDLLRAKFVAEELQYATSHRYTVEVLVYDEERDGTSV